jgi:hypothetical protein
MSIDVRYQEQVQLLVSLLPTNGVERLPAVRWKFANIKKMHRDKHDQALQRLEKTLNQLQA